MAHFAKLNDENIVTQVIVVANEELLHEGIESENKGIAFCKSLFGGTWKQTSYNANFRAHFAGIGFKYDSNLDAFIPPQLYPSWTLNNDTYLWEAPTPYPTDSKRYSWNEESLEWVEVPVSE